MRRKTWMALDTFILLSIGVFIYVGVASFNEQLGASIVGFIIAIGLAGSYIVTILNRRKLSAYAEKQRTVEAEVEGELSNDNKEVYRNMKQRVLEDMIASEIKQYMPDAIVMKNVHVPKSSGGFTEIDVVALSTEGIFVIEGKHLNAQVEGNWANNDLDAVYPNNDRHTIYNPIKQNENHCMYLKNALGVPGDCFRNIVVFGEFTRFTFEGVPRNANICKVNTLIKSMDRLAHRYKCNLEQYKLEILASHIRSSSEEVLQKKMP